MRLRVAVLAALVLGGAGAVTALTLTGGGGDPAVAAAASPTLFVSPTGSDANACTVSPCKTLARAYAVAQDGETVQVGAGSYPDQSVGTGTKAVTFLGSGGPTLHELNMQASNVTFDGVNIDANGDQILALDLGPVTGFVFRNASIGHVTDEKGVLAGGPDPPGSRLLAPVFDNVTFHDVLLSSAGESAQVHNECLYSQAPGLTIRNSRFVNCATMDVLITRGDWWGQVVYGDVTLEGNDFGASRFANGVCCHYYGLAIQDNMGSMSNWTVRNNAFAQDILNSDKQTSGVFCGNTGKAPANWQGTCSGPPPTTTAATTTAPTTTAVTTAPTTTVAPTCASPNLTATLPTDQTITLTWPKVTGATSYRLFKNGTQTSTAGAGATSAKFGSLPYADTILGVTAVCGSLTGPASLTTYEQRLTR